MSKRAVKIVLVLLIAFSAVAVYCPSVLAQCAMCKAGLAGSNRAGAIAETLNLAILVLLIPPVAIFCAIFLLAIKYRKAQDTAVGEVAREELSPEEKIEGERHRFVKKDHRGTSEGSTLAEAT